MNVYIMLLVVVADLHRRSIKRHDNVSKRTHWKLDRKCNFKAED